MPRGGRPPNAAASHQCGGSGGAQPPQQETQCCLIMSVTNSARVDLELSLATKPGESHIRRGPQMAGPLRLASKARQHTVVQIAQIGMDALARKARTLQEWKIASDGAIQLRLAREMLRGRRATWRKHLTSTLTRWNRLLGRRSGRYW